IAQAVEPGGFVMSAGMAEVALVEHEVAHLPWPGAQVAECAKPAADGTGRAVDASERDMRCEAPGFARKADRLAGPFDFLPQAFERLARRDARPERGDLALAGEVADAVDFQLEARPFDLSERRGEVVGHGPLDLADEAQRQMQVRVVHPANAVDALHRVDQRVADRLGRSNGNEESVHSAGRLAQPEAEDDQGDARYE